MFRVIEEGMLIPNGFSFLRPKKVYLTGLCVPGSEEYVGVDHLMGTAHLRIGRLYLRTPFIWLRKMRYNPWWKMKIFVSSWRLCWWNTNKYS